ncbi:hypothetical protein [Streptomyces sp. CBMA29]
MDPEAVRTFVGGDGARLGWPAEHGLRRIPVHGPTPVHPHA